MATLAENAAAVKAAQMAIDAAIVDKGGTTAGGLNNAAAAIAALPSGGGRAWWMADDWPDIREVVANADDDQTRPYKLICLFRASDTVNLTGASKYVTSDGQVLSGGTYTPSDSWKSTHGWCWVIYYNETDGVNPGNPANNSLKALWIHAHGDACALVTSFQSNTTCVAVSGNIGKSSISSTSNFAYASRLRHIGNYRYKLRNYFVQSSPVQEIGADALVAASYAGGEAVYFNGFQGSRLPDNIDVSAITTIPTASFSNCQYLSRLPTNLKANSSVSFAGSIIVTDRDSVAKFEDGVIVGGFVHGLNVCGKDGQTITLNSTIKGLFNETEQTAIADKLVEKNWGLAW